MMPPAELNNPSDALSSAENASRALQPRPVAIQSVAIPHAPPTLSPPPNVFSLLRALQRRLGLALFCGLILAAIVAPAVWFLFPPPKLTARMKLHVAPAMSIFDTRPNAANEINFLRSQADNVRDRFTILAALREPGIANLSMLQQQEPHVEQWLEENIIIEFPTPELMNITLSGDRGDELTKIVAAVTKVYLANFVDKESNARNDRKKEFEQSKATFEKRMGRLKEELRTKQQDGEGVDPEGVMLVHQLAMDQLHAVRRRIAEVHERLIFMSVEMGLPPDWEDKAGPAANQMVQIQSVLGLRLLPTPGSSVHFTLAALLRDANLFATSKDIPINQAEVEAWIEKDQDIAAGTKALQSKKKLLAAMKQKLWNKGFKDKGGPALEKEVEELEREIEKRRHSLRELAGKVMRQRLHQDIGGGRTGRVANYRTLKVLEARLVKEAEELNKRCEQKVKQAADLSQWLDEIDRVKKVLGAANDHILKMDVEQQAPPRITPVYETPILVNPPGSQRKVMITGGSALAALVVVLLAFSWFEFRSRKVYSPDEVVQQLGFQVVGTVPDHSPRSWVPWARAAGSHAGYTQSMLAESVDTARTMLLHVARQEKIQIVMIASALSGEGKTSLASHLAASLARAGRRTILVDSDLRKPTLHRLFERARAPGLSELLRGEVDLAGIIGETAIPNLWLIPAGKADPVALQTLAFDVIPKLFERLRLHYEFIVVDSCPILPVTDGILVGQHVDAVIFSLLREVSRMPRVYAAYQRLASLGIRMLGAVVNGTQNEGYPADYYYAVEEDD